MSTEFNFGDSPQQDLFDERETLIEEAQSPSGIGGAVPTLPLQPKEIRLERISMSRADAYSIKYHYLHRTAKNSKLAFGLFARGAMRGVMIWGLPVAPLKNQFGNTYTKLELRRMFCDETLPKNSESYCLAASARILRKLFPNVRELIAYSDLSNGHRGGIYKAAGWVFSGRIEPNKDGGWSKHPRHNRVESGAKFKWVKLLR